jgi:hypothetical protein
MLGSFPGVFVFQVLAVPILVCEGAIGLAIGFVLSRALKVEGHIVGVGVAVIALLTFAAISAIGFYVGWRFAWEWTARRAIKPMISADRMLTFLSRYLFRWIPYYSRLP